MSVFDPESFGLTEINGATSTERIPIPEGEYLATVKDLVLPPRKIDTAEGPRWVTGIVWEIDDQNVRDITGQPRPRCRQDMWLDINEQGGLDMGKGKNVDLGKARAAFGLNDPSKPFRFDHFRGKAARILVKNNTQKDGANAGQVFSNVTKITPIA